MSGRPRVRIISPIPSIPESDDANEEERQEHDTPMHHRVLYDLLGEDKAESILNPKIEEPSARRQSLHPNGKPIILLPSIDTGMGADAILKTLKEKSDKKVLRLERKIPEEWKNAYNSFLRDRLAKEKPLYFRSFTEKPDVPDLDILKQHGYIYKVRRIRNHTNVMFRSSEQNLNRTALLLNNNPLPESKREGKEISLDRYFDNDTLKPDEPKLLGIEYPQHPNARPEPENLHFLTEKGARCKGTFYAKYAHEDSMKMVTDVPGHGVKLPPAMIERLSISAPVNSPTSRRQWKDQERKISPARAAKWHPLTIGSLMEYSPSKQSLGSGEFSHGTASRWKNVASAGF